MNIKEAIQAMLDGKKVKSQYWAKQVGYIKYIDNIGFCDENENALNINNFKDEIWELYEDPKKKEVVTIEKWLCKDDYGFYIVDGNCEYIEEIHKHFAIKLLDTYEVEL